jgi:hypothetical protein
MVPAISALDSPRAARGAQRPSLVDAGDAQTGRTTGERGPRDVDLAVAEAVGLDHRHQLAGRTRLDGAHVGGHRAQVDPKVGLRIGQQEGDGPTVPGAVRPAPPSEVPMICPQD